MPETMIAQLRSRADGIIELLRELLVEHSTLRAIRLEGVAILGPSNSWGQLDGDGRKLQSRLLNELESYVPLVSVLTRVAPNRARKEIEEANKTLREVVDQSHLSSFGSPEKAFESTREKIEKQQEHLASLYDPSGGDPVYVVDANAALWNPAFEDWEFDGVPRFVLLFTPTLLGELDKLKIAPGEELRRKAERIVNQVNDYGRRSAGLGDVPLRRDRSVVRMIAVEPDFSQTLPWLDPSVQDDRLIAATLEVIRQHPDSPVTIVTRDGNLQNKARHAGMPFVEPPNPPSRSRANRTVEPDETFFVNLSNPSANAYFDDGQGQGTIRNDD